MSLTIQPVDLRSDSATARPTPETRPFEPAAGPPSAERWLEILYGIRPGESSRRTSVPMTYSHAPAAAEWLHRMWGL